MDCLDFVSFMIFVRTRFDTSTHQEQWMMAQQAQNNIFVRECVNSWYSPTKRVDHS